MAIKYRSPIFRDDRWLSISGRRGVLRVEPRYRIWWRQAYEHEGREVIFLAAAVDEPASIVRRFAEKNGMSFIVLLDEGSNVAFDYRVRGIPATFFISRDGEIVTRYDGGMSPRALEDGLSRIR